MYNGRSINSSNANSVFGSAAPQKSRMNGYPQRCTLDFFQGLPGVVQSCLEVASRPKAPLQAQVWKGPCPLKNILPNIQKDVSDNKAFQLECFPSLRIVKGVFSFFTYRKEFWPPASSKLKNHLFLKRPYAFRAFTQPGDTIGTRASVCPVRVCPSAVRPCACAVCVAAACARSGRAPDARASALPLCVRPLQQSHRRGRLQAVRRAPHGEPC